MIRRVIAWAAVLVWAGGIFYLSSIPSYSLTAPPFTLADKVVHFGLYLVLGALLCDALHRTPLRRGVVVIGAIVLASLYGASDEWHQTFVFGRDASVGDWIADTLGAAAGVGLVRLVYRRGHGDRSRLWRQGSDPR
jgi:VanZ family protein